MIISVAFTRNGRDIAWKFFKKNKDELRRRYQNGILGVRLVKVSDNQWIE